MPRNRTAATLPLAVAPTTARSAVVDWQLATVGDVLTDVALMCVYRRPELDAVLGVEAARIAQGISYRALARR